ncbi:MAG: hypothetical protein AAF497_16490, partial [Planctomycetota bacterium]
MRIVDRAIATTLWMTLVLPFFLVAQCSAQDDSTKPNFIFVLSDDIAQGDLGCYGQKLIQTPRL